MVIIRWLDEHLEEVVMGVLLVAMAILMFVQVIMRYIFAHAFPWAEELCRYMFIWFSCMGFAFGVKRHCDLRVDGIYNAAPKALKIVMDVIVTLCMITFAAVVAYGGISVVDSYFKKGTLTSSLQIPTGIVYLSLMVGLLLMLLRIIQRLVKKQRL
ncbi:MAG: TRAP transporter small permease [Parasporobacterium sp.]|nr:TRAP transporter small permease [Parasporobacterium sp.]